MGYPRVTIIGIDTENILTIIRTPVMIVWKYHPSDNNSKTPPTILRDKGEVATLSFKGLDLATHHAIDLLEDFLGRWITLALPSAMAKHLDLLPPPKPEPFSYIDNYLNTSTGDTLMLKHFTRLLLLWG